MTNLTSSIEWTDTTWSPTVGCTKISPGCDKCYAEGIARRFAGSKAFPNGFDLTLHPQRLDDPLRWRKPRKVFVNSMSDLFHQDVPDEFIAQVWAVMAATPQHTYQVLTKRHARMRSLLSSTEFDLAVAEAWSRLGTRAGALDDDHTPPYPLPNVWVGTSVENQQWADIRIPALLDTPAAVRFLSCEPLLGPVDLGAWLNDLSWPGCWDNHSPSEECARCIRPTWVIAGGESGPGARPMHPQWARHLRDQCQAAGVAYFFKQWGAWSPVDTHREWIAGARWINPDGSFLAGDNDPEGSRFDLEDGQARGLQFMQRLPKKLAGRELDGREWNEFPAGAV